MKYRTVIFNGTNERHHALAAVSARESSRPGARYPKPTSRRHQNCCTIAYDQPHHGAFCYVFMPIAHTSKYVSPLCKRSSLRRQCQKFRAAAAFCSRERGLGMDFMMTGLHPVCAPSQTTSMGSSFLSGKLVLIGNLVLSLLLRWFLEVTGVRTVVGTASTLVLLLIEFIVQSRQKVLHRQW